MGSPRHWLAAPVKKAAVDVCCEFIDNSEQMSGRRLRLPPDSSATALTATKFAHAQVQAALTGDDAASVPSDVAATIEVSIAARRAGVDPMTIRRWCDRYKIGYFDATRWRIYPDRLDAKQLKGQLSSGRLD